jgi:hypothetical protein
MNRSCEKHENVRESPIDIVVLSYETDVPLGALNVALVLCFRASSYQHDIKNKTRESHRQGVNRSVSQIRAENLTGLQEGARTRGTTLGHYR